MKKYHRPLLLATAIFMCFLLQRAPLFAAAESIHFNIILFGDKIGDMTVTHEQKSDGTEFYVVETQSKAKILWIDRENHTHLEVTYKNGKLISSSHKEMEKGELKRWTNVHWDGSKYLVESYKGSRTFTEAPIFSIVSIYFKDNRNMKKIFYEAEADFSDLQRPDANTLEFKSSDGNRNIYQFENGKIKSMEFHVSITTVKMVRTN